MSQKCEQFSYGPFVLRCLVVLGPKRSPYVACRSAHCGWEYAQFPREYSSSPRCKWRSTQVELSTWQCYMPDVVYKREMDVHIYSFCCNTMRRDIRGRLKRNCLMNKNRNGIILAGGKLITTKQRGAAPFRQNGAKPTVMTNQRVGACRSLQPIYHVGKLGPSWQRRFQEKESGLSATFHLSSFAKEATRRRIPTRIGWYPGLQGSVTGFCTRNYIPKPLNKLWFWQALSVLRCRCPYSVPRCR